jgi:hypothetical protein
VVPKFGFRNLRGILTGLFLLAIIVASILVPSILFFPALMAYVAYGVVKALVLGFFERLPDRDPMLDEEEGDEAGAELREILYDDAVPAGVTPRRRRGLRRRGRKPRGGRRTPRKRATSPDGGDADGDTSGRHDEDALNEPERKP